MGRCRRAETTISAMSKMLGTAPLLSVRRGAQQEFYLLKTETVYQSKDRVADSHAPYRPIVAKLIDLVGPNCDFH